MAPTLTAATYDSGTDTLTITGSGFTAAGIVDVDLWDGTEAVPRPPGSGNVAAGSWMVGNIAGATMNITDTQVTLTKLSQLWERGHQAVGLTAGAGPDVEYGWFVINVGGADATNNPWWNHYADPVTAQAGTCDATGSHPASSQSDSATLSGSIPVGNASDPTGTGEDTDASVFFSLWPQATATGPTGASYAPPSTTRQLTGDGVGHWAWSMPFMRTDRLTPSGLWYRVVEISNSGGTNRTRYVQLTGDTALPADGSTVGPQPADTDYASWRTRPERFLLHAVRVGEARQSLELAVNHALDDVRPKLSDPNPDVVRQGVGTYHSAVGAAERAFEAVALDDT